MSSPSHCARPAVPPKPDKDKIVSSPPPPTPTTRHPQDPFGLTKLSTVGTQVNMMRKPSPSTSSSTGPRPPRSPSSEGRLQSYEESSEFDAAVGKSTKVAVTSPKPALPPKPKPSSSSLSSATTAVTTNANANKKITGPNIQHQQQILNSAAKTTSSLISKFNSSTQSTTASTSTTINSIANARISKFDNFRNSNVKPKIDTQTTNSAPVARIDELDNLSDLTNSPSPVKIRSPPQSLRQPSTQTVVNKSRFGTGVGIIASKPPPHGPGVQPQSNSRSNTLAYNPTTGSRSIFQFPPPATNLNRPLFSAQQIQQRQTKSASLGRNINFSSASSSVSCSNNFSVNKKSTTLSSRVTPLDLQLSIPGQISTNTQDGKFLRVKSPNTAPVVPARPISFTKPVSPTIFSPKEATAGSVPPPPPPRMRKAQRALSLSSPTSPDARPLSPTLTHQSSLPLSPDSFNNTSSEYAKPVYATVDKEKKWADRQKQQKQHNEHEADAQNPMIKSVSETTASTLISTAMEEDEFGELRPIDSGLPVVHSSLTISAKSWLGKFIDEENKISPEPATEHTDSEHESMIIQRPRQNKNKFIDKKIGSKNVNGNCNGPMSQSTINTSHETTQTQHMKNVSNNNVEDASSTTGLVEACNPNINPACIQDTNNDFNYAMPNPFTSSSPSLTKHSLNKSSHNFSSEREQAQSPLAPETQTNRINIYNNSASLSSNTEHFTVKSTSPTPTMSFSREAKSHEENHSQNQPLQNEKEPLGRNESFLFAMQDTNLKLKVNTDSIDEVSETDNTVVSEEFTASLSISSTTGTGVVTDNAEDNGTNNHTSRNSNNIVPNCNNYDSTTANDESQPLLNATTSDFNSASTSKTTLDLESTNSFLFSTFSRPELIMSSTEQEVGVETDFDYINDTASGDIGAANEAVDNSNGGSSIGASNNAIPNRESVFDIFEKELENQLESLDYSSQLAQSATFNTHEDNTYFRNRYANKSNTNNGDTNTNNNTASRSENSEHDGDKILSMHKTDAENSDKNNAVNTDDPAKYLAFVDSRLQSMQHLLADIVSPSPNASDQLGKASDVQIHKSCRVKFSDAGETLEERGQTVTDGDIVTNILLSSGRFEKNDQNQIQNANKGADVKNMGIGITGRRATAPELLTPSDLPDVDLCSGPSSLVSETTTVESTSMSDKHLHRSLEIPGQDGNGNGIFRRRSWNSSDYSPSPSESSSSSCSYGHNHPRRSCHDGSSTNRRKQVATSWIDEDELSTGALGDGESSDAPAPSSIEDIDHAVQGDNRDRVVKRKPKHGFVSSIFGSFGKGGASQFGPNSYYRNQTRSQFFLDSGISPVPDGENLQQTENRKMKEKTMSLPAVPARQRPPKGQKYWSVTSEVEVGEEGVENGHRPLRRSPGLPTSSSASALPCPVVESDSKTETEFDAMKQPSTSTSSVVSNNNRRRSDIAAILSNLGDSSDVESVHSAGTCYDEVLADLSKSQKKSFYVARELLTSERTFVDVLNLLTLDFPLAMKMAGDALRMPVISAKDMDFILGGLPTLKTVNEVLVADLEKRISGWRENPKVADIIVKTGPFLKHYSAYVRDFERLVQRLESCCKKNPAFDQAVRDFEGNVRCQKLGLRHYMLKPIQRMPQYRLLLEDYLKTLTDDSEDYGDTLKAIAIVREVAEHANDAINIQINAEKLMNLQNRLPNIIVLRTNRFLLKEGELLKVCRKELQPRYFALMTDCLLCMTYNASTGTANMKDLKLRYELPLTGMRISLPLSEDYLNEFSLVSTSRSFNLVAKSSRERDDWMKMLNSAIQDNIKKRTCTTPDLEKEFRIGSEAPVWIQDKRVTMCQVCTAEFTVTFRRHHCRACGKVVCGQCSGNQAPLQYKNNEADRVCDDCYQYLLEEFDGENSEKNTMEVNEVRGRFKKFGYNTTGKGIKQRRSIPDKFKMQANNSGARISGYLLWRERKAWKRHWFVLMERVLYVYAASEDIVAMRTIPVLGYQVEPIQEESFAGIDGQLVFKLTHSGQNPIFFQAENTASVEKWLTAIQEASVLT